MYRFGALTISYFQIVKRLEQEKRRTTPCPFCNGRKIIPQVEGVNFYMLCSGCGAQGPSVRDHDDPAGLNLTSWIYALKVCHDRWNGAKP